MCHTWVFLHLYPFCKNVWDECDQFWFCTELSVLALIGTDHMSSSSVQGEPKWGNLCFYPIWLARDYDKIALLLVKNRWREYSAVSRQVRSSSIFRGTSAGICNFLGRVGNMTAPFLSFAVSLKLIKITEYLFYVSTFIKIAIFVKSLKTERSLKIHLFQHVYQKPYTLRYFWHCFTTAGNRNVHLKPHINKTL